MEAQHVLVAAGCLSAFLCAVAAVASASDAFGNQTRAQQMAQRAGVAGRVRAVQSGVPGLRSAAARLVAHEPVRRFASNLRDAASSHGIAATDEGVLSVFAFACVATLAVCALFGRVALGALFVLTMVLAVRFWGERRFDVRKEAMRNSLPDALPCLPRTAHESASAKRSVRSETKQAAASRPREAYARLRSAFERICTSSGGMMP